MRTSSATTPPAGAKAPVRHPDSPPPGTRLGPHYAQCFGCGDQHPTGLHVQTTLGEGVRTLSTFTVTDDHQGAPGLAHGGVLVSAFDEAMGSVAWLLRIPAVTGRLETDFRRPVPVGTTLHIEAECVGVDGRKIYVQAVGREGGPDGEVAVTASALFVAVPLEHFSTHGRGPAVNDRVSRYNP